MHKVKEGINQYCGPAVLSILTGKTVDECARIFASFKGQVEVKEITYQDLTEVLKKLRYTFTVVDTDLSLYMAMMQVSSKSGFYIIGLPKHVAVLEVTEDNKVFFCDNHTKEPIQGAASARMGQKVDKLIKVELKPEPVFVSSEVQIKSYKYSDHILVRINKTDHYQDPQDNVIQSIGSLSISDARELKRVITELEIVWDRIKND